MNLSFAGCGFLGIYHVGVAVCFKKYAPHLLLEKISGASAGALAACCLLCDMPLGEMTSDFFRVVNEARSHSLGPFSPSFNIQTSLFEGLQKLLPADAHLRVSGRLHISLTRVYDGKNVIISQYNSREDVLQALLCACFIPVFSGLLPPRFHGVRYMDGGFSDNLPTIDENTVTVSPFCGESDICPRDQSSQLFHVNWANTSIELSKQNMNRFARILFPPKAQILSNMCQQGFDDALRFLHRNNLINCTRCLAVQSTFIVSESIPAEKEEYDPECKECKQHRQDALGGNNMPDTVLTVFQTYIDSANKGLANWVFRQRGAKLLHALSIPATTFRLPADFVCATLTKLILTTNRVASIVGDTIEMKDYRFKVLANALHKNYWQTKEDDGKFIESELRRIMLSAPSISSQIWHISKFVIDQLNAVILPKKRQKVTANLTCQIALTDYGQHTKHSHQIDMLMDETPTSNTEIVPSIPCNGGDNDAFEHILNVTTNQEAVYAYYYMDENNKVKLTEIFDMSESDSPSIQTINERETNQQLEFDTDWETQPDFLYSNDNMSDQYFGTNMIEIDDNDDFTFDMYSNNNNNNNNNNSNSIDWNNKHHSDLKLNEFISDDSNDDTYLQPEADQTNLLSDSAMKALSRSVHSVIQF